MAIENHKLVESQFTIATSADPAAVISLLTQRLRAMECIADDPTVQVGIDGFTTHGIRIGVRCRVPTVTYYEPKYLANAAIFDLLSSAGIELSTPRQEVRIVDAA